MGAVPPTPPLWPPNQDQPGPPGQDRPPTAVLPAEAWLTALAGLPQMGPARLLGLTLLFEPVQVWRLLRSGRILEDGALAGRMGPDPVALARSWARAAAAVDVATAWQAHAAAGVGVVARGATAYPGALATDLEPPAVLFHRGALDVLAGPRVAVVGTRRCTRYGHDVARQLGHDLARAGVRVVSGLALGIDGAAHLGALEANGAGGAPPVGVVGCGLDVVYPRQHRSLWQRVAATGVLLSECPLGLSPESWRFPARNRIIAALADAVVVVESAPTGGSMYTVNEALRRDRPVLAVPGSVRSPVSLGTNKLIAEGAHVARDAVDVLTLIGVAPPSPLPTAPDVRPRPAGDAARVLRALGWEPMTLEALVERSELGFGPVSAAVARLEADGWIARSGGGYERVAHPGGRRP